MNQQTMTRLAMILQNQAPSTLDKYIYKLAEDVLLSHENGLSIIELEKEINVQFSLSFTIDEIRNSLQNRNNKGILFNHEKYYLDSKVKDELLKLEPISAVLNKYVSDFIKEYPEFNTDVNIIEKTLLEYIYFCFNSNVDNLLMLLNRNDNRDLSFSEDITEEDINIINAFVSWENDSKNKFIYNIVATCYEYCMLTVKNDNVISKELFKGKRFYLDSNIVFRMAGINKDERKLVTESFVKQCKIIGIKVCCSSVTFDEIFRVIESQVNYIKGNFLDAPPVSPETLSRINPYYESNDFYNLYYEWCQVDGNHYKDLKSFYEHLLDLVREALEKVDIVQIPKEKYISEKDYDELSQKLREYKNTHNSWHRVSKSSSDTDIINIKEVKNKRSINQESIWQTNEFIVSADQLLIAWSAKKFSGVPLVVLPSVWLSIILRFTGRSNDDYKSFCLFLTQRQHKKIDNQIDPIILISKINKKTTKIDVRERIIEEITKHKIDYSFDKDSDYDLSIDKAFDKVVEQMLGNSQQQIDQMKNTLDNQFQQLMEESDKKLVKQKEEFEEKVEIEKITEREKTILLISKQKASKKVRKYRWVNRNNWVFYLVGFVALAFALLVSLLKIQPIWDKVLSLFSNGYPDYAVALIFDGLGACVTLLFMGVTKMCKVLGSEEHEQKLIKKHEESLRKNIERL